MSEDQDFHRISTAGIARRGDKYLLAQRIAGTSIGESWEFPGGKNRSHETPEQTLVREFTEELGVDVTVGRLLFTTTFFNREKTYLLVGYEIEFPESEPDFTLTEHSRVDWKRLDELLELQMAPSDRAIAEALSGKTDNLLA